MGKVDGLGGGREVGGVGRNSKKKMGLGMAKQKEKKLKKRHGRKNNEN
jgi:hypothetical protein